MTIQVKVEFSEEQLRDLCITAFEGGSNYWYQFENRNKEKYPSYLDQIFDEGLMISDAGIDGGGDELTKKVINLKSIEEGIIAMRDKYPKHFTDFLDEDYDADTADVFLQCVTFGRVVYG